MQKVKSNVALVRFGLMHMVATNLCVWLNVIIQETKHEILYFDHDLSAKQKLRENSHTQHPILGNSPFLYIIQSSSASFSYRYGLLQFYSTYQ